MRRPVISRLMEVREHHAPVGALRLYPVEFPVVAAQVREHHAPVGALRRLDKLSKCVHLRVREHHAPVGALRRDYRSGPDPSTNGQGAPRTCRCIETGGRIERGKEDKSSGACETRGTKPGPSTTPPPFHLLRPFPTATPLIPPLRPFSPYSEG